MDWLESQTSGLSAGIGSHFSGGSSQRTGGGFGFCPPQELPAVVEEHPPPPRAGRESARSGSSAPRALSLQEVLSSAQRRPRLAERTRLKHLGYAHEEADLLSTLATVAHGMLPAGSAAAALTRRRPEVGIRPIDQCDGAPSPPSLRQGYAASSVVKRGNPRAALPAAACVTDPSAQQAADPRPACRRCRGRPQATRGSRGVPRLRAVGRGLGVGSRVSGTGLGVRRLAFGGPCIHSLLPTETAPALIIKPEP